MYRGTSKFFRVVHGSEDNYSVWHAEAPTWPTWTDTGRYGTEDECWDFVEAREGQDGYIFQLSGNI